MKYKEGIKPEEYKGFVQLLQGIQNFVEDHQEISYIEFDYYVVHNMTLFSIEPDFDFEKLEKTILNIKKSMSAIKRIFNKPIIILKETDEVLPVENTRIINQDTLLHLANHGQHVSNITKKGVKPRKLLTRHYDDDFGIYENIIFCNFIDEIIALIRKNRKIFDSLLYAGDIMRFNLLEKLNHVNYFLALGKLHTGYIRDFNQYFNISKKMLHELLGINQIISQRLFKPIYKKNIKRNRRLSLKKTNIFLMQKDYRQVYKTYKYLLGNQKENEDNKEPIDFDLLSTNYLTYVELLTIFAVGHFNFEIDPQFKIDLNLLNVTFKYKGWSLNIRNNDLKEILLYFTKNKTYLMVITNNVYSDEELNEYKINYGFDEVIVVNPFHEEYLERDDVYINMQDIDSFRRIQQIILKGMIYSDTQREVCPFCGGSLHYNQRHGFYQCNDCMLQIKDMVCKETNKPFFYTDNTYHKKHTTNKSDIEYDEHWYYEKQVESLMYFRNITKINQNSEIICPHCNRVHETNLAKSR